MDLYGINKSILTSGLQVEFSTCALVGLIPESAVIITVSNLDSKAVSMQFYRYIRVFYHAKIKRLKTPFKRDFETVLF